MNATVYLWIALFVLAIFFIVWLSHRLWVPPLTEHEQALEASSHSSGGRAILVERYRQIHVLGYDAHHDDQQQSLMWLVRRYLPSTDSVISTAHLIKAGAMIVAELDRRERLNATVDRLFTNDRPPSFRPRGLDEMQSVSAGMNEEVAAIEHGTNVRDLDFTKNMHRHARMDRRELTNRDRAACSQQGDDGNVCHDFEAPSGQISGNAHIGLKDIGKFDLGGLGGDDGTHSAA